MVFALLQPKRILNELKIYSYHVYIYHIETEKQSNWHNDLPVFILGLKLKILGINFDALVIWDVSKTNKNGVIPIID